MDPGSEPSSAPVGTSCPAARPRWELALRRNWVPCLVLNAVVAAILLSYQGWEPAREFWERVGAWKARGSYAFSGVATVLAAVVVPALLEAGLGRLPTRDRWPKLGWQAAFWVYRGMEIDLLYRVQARMFGHGTGWDVLLPKLAVDQFVYSALWAVPSFLVVARWIDCGRNWTRARATLGAKFWKETYPTVLVVNWIVWFPAVAVIYSLPPALQFPLFSLVLSFFVLVVTLLARPESVDAH